MRITKRQLRRILKEELLKEVHGGGWNGSYAGRTRAGHEAMETIASELADLGFTLPQDAWNRIAMAIQFAEDESAGK